MAAKSASLSDVLTRQEMARMDPEVLQRIQTGVDMALVKAGAKTANPAMTKANFAELKKELLTTKATKLGAKSRKK